MPVPDKEAFPPRIQRQDTERFIAEAVKPYLSKFEYQVFELIFFEKLTYLFIIIKGRKQVVISKIMMALTQIYLGFGAQILKFWRLSNEPAAKRGTGAGIRMAEKS